MHTVQTAAQESTDAIKVEEENIEEDPVNVISQGNNNSTWIWDLRRGKPGRCAVGEETPANPDQTILRRKDVARFFSIDEGRYACTCPHNIMMQAGDVEINPGPSCFVCDRAIKANHTPMPCVVCGVAVHGACTGLSRVRRERGETYRCWRCGGVREGERCAICSQTFSTNSKRVSCRSCGREVHSGCSSLTREALRRGDPYECSGCMGGGICGILPRSWTSGSRRRETDVRCVE